MATNEFLKLISNILLGIGAFIILASGFIPNGATLLIYGVAFSILSISINIMLIIRRPRAE